MSPKFLSRLRIYMEISSTHAVSKHTHKIIVEILYICITETSLLDLFRFLATKEIKQGHFSMPPVAYISIFLIYKLGAGKFAQEAVRGERDSGKIAAISPAHPRRGWDKSRSATHEKRPPSYFGRNERRVRGHKS